MTHLSPKEHELVALGAALASNCVPCVERHIPEARKAGLTDAQIAEAIRLADQIRQVPAAKVLKTAMDLLPESSQAENGKPPCGPSAQSACCG